MNGTSDPFAAGRAIADAVLYEGYLLYPYTASARKNRIRWQFGVVAPKAYEAAGTGEHAEQQCEVLLEAAGDVRVDVLVRFLRVEMRSVEAAAIDGSFVAVAQLRVDGTQYVTFEEGVECEIPCALVVREPAPNDVPTAQSVSVPIEFGSMREIKALRDASGTIVGRVVRDREPLAGNVCVTCEPSGITGAVRVRVRLENHSQIAAGADRTTALRSAFVSSHVLLATLGGQFASPLDPPARLTSSAKNLENRYLWPALVGDALLDAQRATVVLASPIIVGDFPQIAPQTDTNAFDGTEIDELLTLSVYALSDAERAEARATDPRARALVERAERFDDAAFDRLHAGTFVSAQSDGRSMHNLDDVPTFADVPTFGPSSAPLPPKSFVEIESERAAPESVVVNGVRVAKGSSVRLAPKRNADAWDMFLAGKIATVRGIQQDFEDRIYVTVTIDDDPASEYHEWYGRSFFFDTDEVEPLVRAT